MYCSASPSFLHLLQNQTSRSQHSWECKNLRRKCFLCLVTLTFDFLPQNKWASRSHDGLFLCRVWWFLPPAWVINNWQNVLELYSSKCWSVETVRQRVAPPPIIRGRETTLGSSPSPPSDDWLPTNTSVQPQGVRSRSPEDGITAAITSASAAPTLVGVAETAPPWYVPSLYLVPLTETLSLSHH